MGNPERSAGKNIPDGAGKVGGSLVNKSRAKRRKNNKSDGADKVGGSWPKKTCYNSSDLAACLGVGWTEK